MFFTLKNDEGDFHYQFIRWQDNNSFLFYIYKNEGLAHLDPKELWLYSFKTKQKYQLLEDAE